MVIQKKRYEKIRKDTKRYEKCFYQKKTLLLRKSFFLKKRKDCRESFTFLGFSITLLLKNKQYKVKIVPSSENQLVFFQLVRTIISSNRSISTYELINKLRPVVIGWANYLRGVWIHFFKTISSLLSNDSPLGV